MPVRILIADDNASVRNAMRQVLESRHWEIIEAQDGKDAVAKAAETRPDLVILDLVMPVMNGLTASREIGALLPGVPIIIHTLYHTEDVDLEASRLGVRKVITKSESSVLISAVEELLDSALPAPEAEPAVSSEAVTLMRRTEDKIREACAQLFATKDDAEHANLIAELQQMLHQHMLNLRGRVAEYPVVLERRARKEILPPPVVLEPADQEPTPSHNVAPIQPQDQKATAESVDPKPAAG